VGRRGHGGRPERRHRPPDLAKRAFRATAPNQLWVADITYIPTMAGFLYLAVVLNVFSRRIVGWCMRDTLHAGIVLDALNIAATQRRATDVIHHSDQGSQYRAIALVQRCKLLGDDHRWDRAAMPTKTPWLRASSPRAKWSASRDIASPPTLKPASPSSATSKGGTIGIVGTPPWGSGRR